jgi:hypothetical protein
VLIAAALLGDFNGTTIFADPQQGHFNRLSSHDNGKSQPLVQSPKTGNI